MVTVPSITATEDPSVRDTPRHRTPAFDVRPLWSRYLCTKISAALVAPREVVIDGTVTIMNQLANPECASAAAERACTKRKENNSEGRGPLQVRGTGSCTR